VALSRSTGGRRWAGCRTWVFWLIVVVIVFTVVSTFNACYEAPMTQPGAFVRIVALVVAAALLSSCGDTIDRASNCMELETAWRAAIVEVLNAASSNFRGEIDDRVAERARELVGEALGGERTLRLNRAKASTTQPASKRPFYPSSAERYFSRPPRGPC
jgi:hypothetical protein